MWSIENPASPQSLGESQKSIFSDTSMTLYTLWEESESSSLSSIGQSTPEKFVTIKNTFSEIWDNHSNDKRVSRKKKYSRGISAAVPFIVDYVSRFRYFGSNEIDIVAGMLILGKDADLTSDFGKKLLKKIKNPDRDFAKIALKSAVKVRDLGGRTSDIETAVVSVLVCRGLKYIRKTSFDDRRIEELSERTAHSVINGYTISKLREPNSTCTTQENAKLHENFIIDRCRSFHQIDSSFKYLFGCFYIENSMLLCNSGTD